MPILPPGSEGALSLTLGQISAPIGNYIIIDESTDLELGDGERLVPSGTTVEMVDSAITGMAPFFTESIRIQDFANCVIQAPLTLNAIVCITATPFINCDEIGFYIQNNIIIVTPAGPLYNLVSTTLTPAFDSSFFIDNMAYFGLSMGLVEGVDLVSTNGINVLNWTTGVLFKNCLQVDIDNPISGGTVTGSGPYMRIEGERTADITVRGGTVKLAPNQSFIDISPDVNDDVRIALLNNLFNSSGGGDFFEPGVQGTIQSYSNNSSSGATDSYADNLAGGTTVFSTQTSPGNDRKVTLAVTTNFDGTHKIFNDVPGVSFDIPVPFAVGGTVGTWTFNSVTVGSAGNTLVNGDAAQIYKSTNYNKGRIVFGVVPGVSFNIDDVPFNGDDAAGIFDTSIKQNDPRVTCVGNGDQPDTSTLINLGITVTETLTGTSTPQNIETWQVFRDDQFTLNPPGGTLGSWRYDARAKPLGTNIFARWIAVSGNPAADIEFLLKKSVAGGPFNQIGPDITGTLTNKSQTLSIFIEDDADFDDDYLLQFFDAANNSVNILNASITQYKIG